MPQIDPFASHRRGMQSPATHHLSVTPQNAVDLPVRPRVLRVLTSGGLSLRDEAGTVITCAVTAGEPSESPLSASSGRHHRNRCGVVLRPGQDRQSSGAGIPCQNAMPLGRAGRRSADMLQKAVLRKLIW
uniref:spike base protein, RCAP_Rcc01079 family n=1 Tax=Leisingera caerulea TaxID=506591 RepID=UPI001FDFD015|nr:hypothetical protein [Leisingera caerulea]